VAMAGIDTRIAEIYGGPLDEFVTARDALARELRAAGDKDKAAEVKALRKPRALAWALDAAGLAAPDGVTDLAAAAEAVGAAQSGNGDIREAMARLRAAEGRVVDAAVGAAEGYGQRVDRAALGGAVRAVIADPDALADLQAGRLVDTPDAGGLGLALPSGEAAPRRTPAPKARAAEKPARRTKAKAATKAKPDAEPARPEPDKASLAAARRELAAAERALRTATNTARREATTASEVEARAAAARRKADEAAAAEEAARERLDAAQAALDAFEA
jgi:hypothetical protein